MAILNSNVRTLADWAKRYDGDNGGIVTDIVELLAQSNPILDDMLFMEGNLPTGHRTTVRTGLPTVAWRLLNQGVQPSKSHTAQIDEQCGMLEAWSEVDVALAKLAGNEAEFRMSEATAFIEAMNQEMVQTLFYGNSAIATEEFTGLSVRYSDSTATNGNNVIKAGGTQADNSSIWLVAWGAQTVHGIFPKGSQAGLQHADLGEETAETTAGIGGARLRVYRDKWTWNCGVAVRDWRYAVRIANIDISNLVSNSSAANLVNLMIKAIYRLPNMNTGKAVFYMNRTVFEFLDIQRLGSLATGGGITYDSVDGKMIPSFRGIPIRIVDQLLETEGLAI